MTSKGRKELTNDPDESSSRQPIDLASTLRQAKDEEKVYICNKCATPLTHDPLYKLKINPFAGETYYCPNIAGGCSQALTHVDSSLVRLKVQPKQTAGAIPSNDKLQQDFILDTVPEDTANGLGLEQNPYDRYDPDPSDEEMIRGWGGEIVDSRIEL